jgi:tRNA(Ile)-lysidine synthase TilS/MesJ
MALAFLLQRLRRLGNGPSLDLTALIVDHNHRSDSREEAITVSKRLDDLG